MLSDSEMSQSFTLIQRLRRIVAYLYFLYLGYHSSLGYLNYTLLDVIEALPPAAQVQISNRTGSSAVSFQYSSSASKVWGLIDVVILPGRLAQRPDLRRMAHTTSLCSYACAMVIFALVHCWYLHGMVWTNHLYVLE